MTVYIRTPQQLKEDIDILVEKEGTKAFVLSSNLHGQLSIPSKRVPLFRIPVSIPEHVFGKDKMSLGGITKFAWYLYSVKDLEVLSEESKENYKKSCERSNDG